MSKGILDLCRKCDRDRIARAERRDEPMPMVKRKTFKNTLYKNENGDKATLSDLAYSYRIGHAKFSKLYNESGGDWEKLAIALKENGNVKRTAEECK